MGYSYFLIDCFMSLQSFFSFIISCTVYSILATIGANKEKFSKKLFILKQNKYEVIDWDWDCCEEIHDIIKCELKQGFMRHFSNNNKLVYQYYTFIKTQKNKWESFGNTIEVHVRGVQTY